MCSVVASLQLVPQHVLKQKQKSFLFSFRALKRLKMRLYDAAQLYGTIDSLSFISNIYERLLSTAKYVLKDRQDSVTRTNLGPQLLYTTVVTCGILTVSIINYVLVETHCSDLF